jgi:Aldo/keto reductase family
VWQLATCASAARELDKSLKRLGFDYVDLYLIHWPIPVVTARSWRQLQELRERGLAQEVGVSNFGVGPLERLQQRGSSLVPAVTRSSSARSITGGGCSSTACATDRLRGVQPARARPGDRSADRRDRGAPRPPTGAGDGLVTLPRPVA